MTANEAHVKSDGVKLDALVHPVTEKTRDEPPAIPELVPKRPEILRILAIES